MKIALLISVLLHAMLFVSFDLSGLGDSKNGNPEQLKQGTSDINKDIMPAPKKDTVTMKIISIPKPAESKSKVAMKKKTKKQQDAEDKAKANDCKYYFWGIGVTSNSDRTGTCIVGTVYPDYPAAQNGLKPGDRIINPDCGSIRGEEGTTLDLVWERNGQYFSKTIHRGKICIGN